MSVTFQIVVSSENTQYMGWQTQLFCFSALTTLGQYPTIIVHQTGFPLRPEFSMLRDDGFNLIETQSFSVFRKGKYPPRNEIGSLLTIASMPSFAAEHILFCEPDMLFVGPLEYRDTLSGEFYHYLHYEQNHIMRAAEKVGLADVTEKLNETNRIGVPYLIPVRDVKRIASRWIEVLDAFDIPEWIDIMYAFGFALRLEGIHPETTHVMNDNLLQSKSLTGRIIHYCYGDSIWSKRSFVDRSPLNKPDWSLPRANSGTVLHEIVRQIRDAKKFIPRDTLSNRFFRTLRGKGGLSRLAKGCLLF
jgi:hypothetical protein